MSSSTHTSIDPRPDIVALRGLDDRAAEHRAYQVVDGLILLAGPPRAAETR
ncbi:hypothetical protein R4P64_30700 [Rhodococcus sp. IEGM 1366]|uniref:hypothetical protein n=1 Tax=Rhodococcus sp. IEGM 1366 TaxID=3082223 RepID=UPI0029533BBA|nr:hypothetical protein [Rhodococcus sp. IEGM 1366]MDV8070898.1 hypothetical protein [Rhodococcus sp. IEGM 1366]